MRKTARMTRLRQAGFTLIELLIGMVLAAVAIGASLSILAQAAHIVVLNSPNTAFESALISAWHIANDFELAGQSLLPVQRDWFCYLSSQQQTGASTYTVLAPFLLLTRPVKDMRIPAGPSLPTAPWLGMYSTLALIEYASYYPFHPAVDVMTPASAHVVGLRSLSDTGSDAAVGLFTGFTDPEATTRLSGFGRPCFVSEKTGISRTRSEYEYKPVWLGSKTLNLQDSVDAVQPATTCAHYLGADWIQLRGAMPAIHVNGSWTFGKTLVYPHMHTVISQYVPNFVAWSVTPEGQLLRNNLLVHANGGLESNLVGAISVEPLRCTPELGPGPSMSTCHFVAPPSEGLDQFLRASTYSPSDVLFNWKPRKLDKLSVSDLLTASATHPTDVILAGIRTPGVLRPRTFDKLDNLSAAFANKQSDLIRDGLRPPVVLPGLDIFYRSTGTNAYFAGTIAPMEDYSSVYGLMVSVTARQSRYDVEYSSPDIVRCCLKDDVFTAPAEPTVMTGRGLSPRYTNWRHFHWETAFIMVPLQSIHPFDARRIRTFAGIYDVRKMAL